MKKYVFWFKLAIGLQLITGLFHSLSFFNSPLPENETERQLFDLMESYYFDFGAGFHHSVNDLMLAFSISLSLLLFFSAALNIFLLKSEVPVSTLRGVVVINLFTYVICFIVMSLLTFLPPIICTGLIMLALSIAYLLMKIIP